MRKNKVKERWENGDYVVNGWLHIPAGWSAEVMAHAGFDSLVVDMQHGMSSFETVVTMFQAISTTDTVPMARVPWNEPGIIGNLLDAGAYGIICPMVNSAEECERFVGACRYFPDGYRSKGPTRARIYAGDDYAEHANREVIAMAMIETKTAVDQAFDITAVPHLDGIYVGPGDLSLTLGGGEIGRDLDEPIFNEAIAEILAACEKNNIVAGIHTANPEQAGRMIERGFRFVTISSDSGLLGQIAQNSVAELKGMEPQAKGSIY